MFPFSFVPVRKTATHSCGSYKNPSVAYLYWPGRFTTQAILLRCYLHRTSKTPEYFHITIFIVKLQSTSLLSLPLMSHLSCMHFNVLYPRGNWRNSKFKTPYLLSHSHSPTRVLPIYQQCILCLSLHKQLSSDSLAVNSLFNIPYSPFMLTLGGMLSTLESI